MTREWWPRMMSQEPVQEPDVEGTRLELLEARTQELEDLIRLIETRVKALENSIPPAAQP